MASPRTAFDAYARRDERGARDWLASLAASSAIYVRLAVARIAIGSTAKKVAKLAAVEVKFVEKIVNEPPPPPPQAVPEVKPQAPAAAAPVVRPDQKIRRLDKPPPPKEMVAPKE